MDVIRFGQAIEQWTTCVRVFFRTVLKGKRESGRIRSLLGEGFKIRNSYGKMFLNKFCLQLQVPISTYSTGLKTRDFLLPLSKNLLSFLAVKRSFLCKLSMSFCSYLKRIQNEAYGSNM